MTTTDQVKTIATTLNKGSIADLINPDGKLNSIALKKLAMAADAGDVGIVPLDREHIAEHLDDIEAALPGTKSLLCIAVKINRHVVRAPFKSISNFEFYQTGEQLSKASRDIANSLDANGLRAIYTPWGFPYESDRFPGKLWIVGHKQVAEEAGLGLTGKNRLVIHPKFGGYVYFNTILINREVDSYDIPVEKNQCDQCNMCVITCPTGAISKDGNFDFVSCVTHNYREKVGGFSDWVENVIDSKNKFDYRKKIDDRETFSMWQTLSFKAQNKCDYCMVVCPAGDEPHVQYDENSKKYVDEIIKPLQTKDEKVYVVPGSDAEAFVAKNYPHKTVRRVSNGLRPPAIEAFLFTMPLIFQRDQSEGLSATYNFDFIGAENMKITATIKDKKLTARKGHADEADIHIPADSKTWCDFLAKEKNIMVALLTRKVKTKGPLKLFIAFGSCFPS